MPKSISFLIKDGKFVEGEVVVNGLALMRPDSDPADKAIPIVVFVNPDGKVEFDLFEGATGRLEITLRTDPKVR